MYILLCILSILTLVLGIIGCFIPLIPGPPLLFAALLISQYMAHPTGIPIAILLVGGAGTLIMGILDFFVPALMKSLYGTTRWGMWGSILGLLVGILCFPPLGIPIGLFCGAFLGELIGNTSVKEALQAGYGTCLISAVISLLKLSFIAFCTWYYVITILHL